MKILSNASESFLSLNPSIWPGKTPPRTQQRGKMNATESEFALMLEAQKRNGEILRYEYEGIRLLWSGGMHYTPDFVVFDTTSSAWLSKDNPEIKIIRGIKLIEVKGAHIWDRDIVRFKGARAYWPEFSFEMHQKTKHGWKRKF